MDFEETKKKSQNLQERKKPSSSLFSSDQKTMEPVSYLNNWGTVMWQLHRITYWTKNFLKKKKKKDVVYAAVFKCTALPPPFPPLLGFLSQRKKYSIQVIQVQKLVSEIEFINEC